MFFLDLFSCVIMIYFTDRYTEFRTIPTSRTEWVYHIYYIIEEIMPRTRLQVLFINGENDEGSRLSRGLHWRFGPYIVHVNMTFFFASTLNNVSDKRPIRDISEMFMDACTKTDECIYWEYLFFLFFIIIIIILRRRRTPLFHEVFSPRLSFPINLTQILVDEGYRGVIY